MAKKEKQISRRNFLVLGAAAAAGCATQHPQAPVPVQPAAPTPPVIAPAPPLPASPVTAKFRVGVIGCGQRGRELMAAAARKPFKITAVADANADLCHAAADACHARACRRWQYVITAADVDAVIVATPDHLHAPIAIAAMNAGKDVYCERPMALALADAQAVRDAAARTKRVLQVGVQQTAESQWHAARKMVADGKLGALRWSQGQYGAGGADTARPCNNVRADRVDWAAFLGTAQPCSFDPDRFVNWRKYSDYAGGAAWSDLYWKLATLLVALGPEWPSRVSAAGGIYAADGRNVPDSFVLNAEFPKGHTIVLASAMDVKTDRPAIIRGTQAALEFHGDSLAFIGDGGYGAPQMIPLNPQPDLLDNWAACMESRAQCVCGPELGYRTAAILAMATEAWRAGKSVAWNPATETVAIPAPMRKA